MGDTLNPVARLADLPLKRRDRRPGIGADETNVSRALGLTTLGASYFEVQPGDSAFPYHVHHSEDEIIFIIAGRGTYRFGTERYEVTSGDMLGAPAGGPDLAHQLTNTGTEVLKYFCVSDLPNINVAELPEDGEIIVNRRGYAAVPGSRLRFRKDEGIV